MAVNKIAQKAVKKKKVYSKKSPQSIVNKIRSQFEAQDWASFSDSDKLALAHHLNFANYEFEGDVFAGWVTDYAKAHRPADAKLVAEVDKQWFTASMGLVGLMVTKGSEVNPVRRAWLDAKVDELVRKGSAVLAARTEADAKAKAKAPKMVDVAGLLIEEIEAILDAGTGSVYDLLTAQKANASQVETVKAHYAPLVAEAELLQKDKELQEGFRHSLKTAADRRAYLERVRSIITDADLYVNGTKAQKAAKPRAPRAKKAVPAEKVVQHLKFSAGDPDLKVQSVDKKALVGASTAVLYHKRYKTLIVMEAADGGFSAKGTSVTNVATAKQRKLRKPEVTLPEVLAANKARVGVVFRALTTTENDVSHRTSDDLVLLKIFK